MLSVFARVPYHEAFYLFVMTPSILFQLSGVFVNSNCHLQLYRLSWSWIPAPRQKLHDGPFYLYFDMKENFINSIHFFYWISLQSRYIVEVLEYYLKLVITQQRYGGSLRFAWSSTLTKVIKEYKTFGRLSFYTLPWLNHFMSKGKSRRKSEHSHYDASLRWYC